MLKLQITSDLFLVCAVFTAVAIVLNRLIGRGGELPEAREAGWLDLLGAGFIFLVYYGFVVAGGADAADPEEITWLHVVLSMAVQLVLMGVIMAFIAPRKDLVDFFGLRWPGWPWVFLIVPVAVLITWMVAQNFQRIGYFDWVESLLGEPPVQEAVRLLRESQDPLLLGVMVVAVVVVAPITEEVIFRGHLFRTLERFTGAAFAAVMSGLIFAVIHNELAALPVLFFLGVLLALVYRLTGSLWAPIAVHAAFNSVTVLAQFALRLYPELVP